MGIVNDRRGREGGGWRVSRERTRDIFVDTCSWVTTVVEVGRSGDRRSPLLV